MDPRTLPMRFKHLLSLAAASSAVTTSAAAQDRSAIERTRITTPSYRYSFDEPAHRAALGVVTTATGTARDTLGLMITSITKGSPAEKAGLEEGNRIAAINGVSLKVNAADIEDGEMSSALTRRLVRELSKAKPGDEVELKVYRDGRTQTIKVKTADSDELFPRNDDGRTTQADRDNRPALGLSLGNTGGKRDTLGVLVMSVSDSSPASRAGIEEGNRIAAINSVNLRVAREDAGDRYLGSTKVQRLQREILQLKPGDNVTLKIYSSGQFRDVTLKVARAGDQPKNQGGMMIFGGDGFGAFPAMPPMPAMPAMPSMRSMPMIAPMPAMPPMDGMRFDLLAPGIRRSMQGVRVQLDNLLPQIERISPRVRMQLDELGPRLEQLRPQLEQIRPQLERLRLQARPRIVMTRTV